MWLISLFMLNRGHQLQVLQGSKIRSNTYTVYLRGLSFTYLLTIVFTGTSIARKVRIVNTSLYVVMVYYAHLERYMQNAFLFTGNLIVAALAAETLYGMLVPLSTLRSVSNQKRSASSRHLLFDNIITSVADSIYGTSAGTVRRRCLLHRADSHGRQSSLCHCRRLWSRAALRRRHSQCIPLCRISKNCQQTSSRNASKSYSFQ